MTVRHVVAWRLASTDSEERVAQADEITARLYALVGVVPSITELSAGRGIVEGNWDVAVVADFADADGLQEYQVHPAHQEVAAYVRSLVADRAAVDFDLP